MDNSTKLSTKRAKEIGRLGGIKSGESRRKKSDLKKITQYLLNQKIEVNVLEYLNLGYLNDKIKYDEAMIIAQIIKAIKGDTSAATFVRDTSGQKPKDEVVQDQNVTIDSLVDILDKFNGELF